MKKNALEWSVFGASVILIAAVLALLVANGVRSKNLPPSLEISAGEASREGSVYRLPLRVVNRGDTTAEDARIEIILFRGSEEIERAELAMPFVPKRSSRKGWVEFLHDPAAHRLETRAAFNEP
jgi:uncharacterized protein (TIGR02588 family)